MSIGDRRREGRLHRTEASVAVREIIARTTLDGSDPDGRCYALIDIELCLFDGRRVQAREDDRMRIEVDTSGALSTRASVQSAVRNHIRRGLHDESVAGWSAFDALARLGATWSGDGDQVDISVDMSEPAVTAA